MELSKNDTQAAKGIAVIGMVMLHLFCRLGDLPYEPLIWIGNTPLVYYFGLLGDLCVPVFCFCSGYAHYLLLDRQGADYPRRIPGKILRFLSNYWIVLILFSVLGLFFGRSGKIPVSFETFLGNFLLYKLTYNGAWWFVLTYLFLLVLSPVFGKLVRRMNTLLLLALSGAGYFAAYLFRFNIVLEIPVPVADWVWNQLILLGTSQLGYVVGMCCRRHGWVARLREFVRESRLRKWLIVAVLPCMAALAHCRVQSTFVAPGVAFVVLASLFAVSRPVWLDRVLVFFGKHSTNIWLCHMFFYVGVFEGFVFTAKYPPLITMLMFGVCIAVSCAIEALRGRCRFTNLPKHTIIS